MTTVFDVASYIVQRLGKKHTISRLKLQCLCYYAQAWTLAWTKKPLFKEEFDAWANFPCCPQLARKIQGLLDIEQKHLGKTNPLTKEEKHNVDIVLNYYGDRDAEWLRELVVLEDPWNYYHSNNSKKIITKESMKLYYTGLPNKTEQCFIERKKEERTKVHKFVQKLAIPFLRDVLQVPSIYQQFQKDISKKGKKKALHTIFTTYMEDWLNQEKKDATDFFDKHDYKFFDVCRFIVKHEESDWYSKYYPNVFAHYYRTTFDKPMCIAELSCFETLFMYHEWCKEKGKKQSFWKFLDKQNIV